MSDNEVRRRWGLPLGTQAVDAEVREELQFHLESRVERLIQQGFDERLAREEAERRFGPLDDVRRACLEQAMGTEKKRMRRELWSDFWRELVQAARGLRRRPSFTVTAVLTIALGLGAVTSIFSLVDAVLLRALPYPDSEDLVSVWGPWQPEANYLAFSELPAFSVLSAMTNEELTLADEENPLQIRGARVTPSFFTVLRQAPILGRPLLESDLAGGERGEGEATVAVVSERLARQHFGSVDRALGQSLRLEGTPYEVVGVLPDRVRLPTAETNVWLPLGIVARETGHHWGDYYLQLLGRLAPGATAEIALDQVRAEAQRLRTQNPIWTPSETYGDTATVSALQQTLAGDLSRQLRLLMWASLVVLLVACVNVANLLLARSRTRELEAGIRTALGAGRGRLVWSLLLESTLIAVLGTVLGLAISTFSIRALVAGLPSADPRFGEIGIDARVLVFSIVATLLTALVFGLFPAWIQTRRAADGKLGSMGRGSGQSTRRWSKSLVVVQMALSLVLLIAAGLMLKSLWRLWNVNLGFQEESVVVAQVDPSSGDYVDAESRIELYRQILQLLEASTVVDSVAASTFVPMQRYGRSVYDAPSLGLDPNDLPNALNGYVTPGYFETIGLPLLRGRDLSWSEGRRSCTQADPCTALVNQALEQRTFRGEALNEIIGVGFLGWFEIVGVVADARLRALEAEPEPAFFLPHAQALSLPPLSLEVLVRGRAPVNELTELITRSVRSVDARIPVVNHRALDVSIRDSVADKRFLAGLLVAFALLSLVLGGVGIYGVISFLVEERRREIGVRAALGATPQELRRGVLGQATVLVAVGALLGALASVALLRVLQGQLFQTTTLEVELWIAVPAILFAVAMIAAWVPARRAARLNPVSVLREE